MGGRDIVCTQSCAHGSIDAVGATPAAQSGIGRRAFLAQSAVMAAVAALAACGLDNGSTAPDTIGMTIKLSDYPALANVGGIATFTASGNPVAVVRTATSTFVALSRICPHQGGTIQTQGSGFRCPEHGATFSASGTWTGGQRTSNMRSYATTYDSTAGTVSIG